MQISSRIAGLSPSGVTGDLPAAVREIRESLVKDSPLCLVFTRLDLANSELLTEGVRQLSIVGTRLRRRLVPIVVGVSAYHCIQPANWYDRNAQLLLELSTRPVVRALHGVGAKVLEWRPAEEEGSAEGLDWHE